MTHPGRSSYDAHKESARGRQAEQSRSGRDIGDIPPVADPARRARAEASYRIFCETYFPDVFNLGWSDDHLKVIAKVESAVIDGELFALAMPRGTGKTSLSERAALWAMLTGRRRFISLIGADEDSAIEMIDTLKQELETNELLAADFPEVCYPIAMLEGITQRAKGQLYQGKRTRIGWKAKEIILPTIPGSRCSGAIVRTAGITGRIRGMKYQRPDGESARPDMVILDDPQTDESAKSLSQNDQRERILAGAILGLAGPGKSIAGIMPCTVIFQGDMADRILDKDKHPEWRGERCKTVYAFPTNEKLWDQYAEIYLEGLRREDKGEAANSFYRQHRAEMDAGAIVAWPDRFKPGEVSAIQSAMNIKITNPASFFAEYQNEPLSDKAESDDKLTETILQTKIAGVDRRIIPLACHHLTAFVDVQQKMLWWAVCAWGDGFCGQVVDYGAWPEQGLSYYTLRDAKRTLARSMPGTDLEAQLYSGLDKLADHLTAQPWLNEAGDAMHISRLAVDANWGQSTNVVYQWCRETKHRAIVMPSHGRGIGASQKPLNEYEKKPGDQPGHYWRITAAGKRATRYLLIDTNYWKSFVAARLRTPKGGQGSLTIHDGTPTRHRMLIEHLTSEYPVAVTGRGRQVDEWKLLPARDNHLWDCVVGSAVCASMLGVATVGHVAPAAPRRKRVKRKATYQD